MFISEDQIIIRLVLATLLGGLIGLEREYRHKKAGLRTNMLVALGAALAMIVSITFDMEPARIAAGIITGIGFLGGGIIIQSRGEVHGITTAATVWVVAAVGMSAGLGYYSAAVTAAAIALVVLYILGNTKIRLFTKLND